MRRILLLALLLAFAGCHHATVETGQSPGPSQVDIPWANSFIYGLVPPSTVDAEGECASGVARVETQLSFLNQIVGAVTFGIYTPMHITVTCAAGMEDQSTLPVVRTEAELAVALESGAPFLVQTD